MKAGDLVADRYRLLRTIGEGGMGSVWAAHHELIGRDVAIKVTGEKVSKRREARERFLNEARAVGKVRHPNVIDVMDVGQLPDGRLYIVFELLEGRTLEEQLEKKGRFPSGDAAAILIEICRGLEAAHAAGIVHRDLKPANIFLHRAPGGSIVIKLLDFGISKTIDEQGVSLSVTQTGVVMGTPQYMSVEQARGRDDIDLRADIWSAGAILYELATGRVAFDAANYNAVLDKIMHDEALPLLSSGVNEPGLQAIVSRCLTKLRGQRYQSARELREDLQALLPRLPVGAGGLKLQSSVGMAAVAPRSAAASVAPVRPDDDVSHPLRAARHEPTLAAPPSDPVIAALRHHPPSTNPPLSTNPLLSTSPPGSDQEPPSSSAQSVDSPPKSSKRRLAATVGAIAVVAAIVIGLSTSGNSSSTGVAPAPTLATAGEPAPGAGTPGASNDPARTEPGSQPAPTTPRSVANPRGSTASPAAPASAASSRKPPSVRTSPDAPKKSVTRVESAGF